MILKAITIFVFALISINCLNSELRNENTNQSFSAPAEISETAKANIFDEYLKNDFAPADGFDFPLADFESRSDENDEQFRCWKLTFGNSGNDVSDFHANGQWKKTAVMNQKVFAAAEGRVVSIQESGAAGGNLISIEHIFYENNKKLKVQSVYSNLSEITVKKGELIKRRQNIGSIGQDAEKKFPPHLHFELRFDGETSSANGNNEFSPSPVKFINDHRKLFVPQNEPTLVLVDQPSYKMRLYRSGKMQGEYEVSFGQSKGAKRLEGDNKTPVGMYFVVQKHRGKFPGAYGAYYGGHWIKLNYPNKYDAARGLDEKLISAEHAKQIRLNWNERLPTPQNTKLGNGIGFHGWVREWENSGSRHLSWGCIVMHIYDISRLYDRIPEGAMVVIF